MEIDDVRGTKREQDRARAQRVYSSPLWRRGCILLPCAIPFGIVGGLLGGHWATVSLSVGFVAVAIGSAMLMLAIRRNP
jgi:uncharacterized membrane protein YfcA